MVTYSSQSLAANPVGSLNSGLGSNLHVIAGAVGSSRFEGEGMYSSSLILTETTLEELDETAGQITQHAI